MGAVEVLVVVVVVEPEASLEPQSLKAAMVVTDFASLLHGKGRIC
jgi:hypothetical protein